MNRTTLIFAAIVSLGGAILPAAMAANPLDTPVAYYPVAVEAVPYTASSPNQTIRSATPVELTLEAKLNQVRAQLDKALEASLVLPEVTH